MAEREKVSRELLRAMNQSARWPRWLGPPPPSLTGILPFEQGLLLALAAVVGIYAGLAAGLLSNFIALFQFVLYRGASLVELTWAQWIERFAREAVSARWHFEFLVVGALAVLLGAAVPVLSRRFAAMRVIDPKLVRAVAFLAGFGMLLYYPLLMLSVINRTLRTQHGDFLAMAEGSTVLRVVVPALGLMAVGWLVHHVTPESGGHGVAEVIEAVLVKARRIPGKLAFWKALTSGLTIGAGGSAGREGPVVQMGSAVGSEVGTRLGLPRDDVALLLACGGGAGIAASFNAPIAGAMFALEIILRDFGVRSFSPIVVSAVTATITSRALIGAGGEIAQIQYQIKSAAEVGSYAVLGLLAAVVAIFYVRWMQQAGDFFAGRGESLLSRKVGALPLEVRTLIGGLLVGLIGLITPRVMGNGYETMNAALAGQLTAGVMFGVLVLKILATGFTLGSGASGGSFFPAVFLGAMIGGAFGEGVHWLLPTHSASSGAYAAVGMAAVVGAATQGPLTAVIMLFELTGSYEIVVPLMIAVSVAVVGSRAVLGGSMYTLHLAERGIHVGAPAKRLLAEISVADAMSPEVQTVRDSMPFDELVELMATTEHRAYPVIDAGGKLVGLLSLDDARAFLADPTLQGVVVARDLCREHPPTVTASQSLEAALLKMSTQHADHLPVVAEDDPDRVVGILTSMDLVGAYSGAVGSGGRSGDKGE